MSTVYLDGDKTKPLYGRLDTAKTYDIAEDEDEDYEPDPVLEAWITAQNTYLMADLRRLFIVNQYTYHGDVLANTFLRKKTLDDPLEILTKIRDRKKSVPFGYQIYDNYDFLLKQGLEMPERSLLLKSDNMFKVFDNNFKFFTRTYILNKLIKDYCSELYRIILNAPRSHQDIVVYRGVRGEDFLEKGILHFKSESFTSTSLSINQSMSFIKGLNCCLYKLLIRKNTPCLYINDVSAIKDNEFEVLLPYNVVYAYNPVLLKLTYNGAPIFSRQIFTEGITEGYFEPTYMKLAGGKKKRTKTKRRSKKTI